MLAFQRDGSLEQKSAEVRKIKEGGGIVEGGVLGGSAADREAIHKIGGRGT